jgi:hypothetical protein
MMSRKVFDLDERQALMKRVRQTRRSAQAQHKRTLAALAIEERARVLHLRLFNIENGAAIGRMLTELRVSGWKKALIRMGISSPLESLERMAELAGRQLERFLEEEAPDMRSRAEAVAKAIEGPDETPPGETPPEPEQPRPETNGAAIETADSSWGRYG